MTELALLPLADAAVRGMLIALEEINARGGVLGQPLQLVIEDTGGRAVSALDAAKKLVSVDKVAAVLGIALDA